VLSEDSRIELQALLRSTHRVSGPSERVIAPDLQLFALK